MLDVIFSPKARHDLMDIGDYIAKDSRANARRFVARLMAQCQKIAMSPMGYASRQDLAVGLRMAPIGNHVIFFSVLNTQIRIERVLHGARDLPSALLA